MEFTDLDGDRVKVSAGRRAVILEAWGGGEFVFLVFDPHAAVNIASAIIAVAHKAQEAQQ